MKTSIPILAIALILSARAQVQEVSVTMSGIVTDSKTRIPVAGARVSIVGALAAHDEFTDSGGIFILPLSSGVKPGQIARLIVERDGYKPHDENVAVAGALPRQILLIPKPRKVRSLSVHGYVRTADN